MGNKSIEDLEKEVQRLKRRVSELEEAEKRSGETEVRYRHLFENLNDAVLVADVETGTVVEANRKAEALTGRTRDELIGSHQSTLHPSQENTEYKQRFKKHTEKGKEADYDGEVLRSDGAVVPVHISAAPVKVGEKNLILGIFVDITERKRVEDELRRSKEFAEKLLDSIKDGIGVVDTSGRHTNVNRAFCDMTGYSREELMSTPPPFPYWPEEEREKIASAFKRAVKGELGDRMDFEFTFRRKNGERFPVLLSPASVRDENGKVIRYIATVKDITERKRLEEEMLKAENLESIGVLAGGIAHDFNNLLSGVLGNISFARQLAEPEGKIAARLKEAEKATLSAKDLTQQLLTFSRGGTPSKESINPGEFLKESVSFALRGSNVRPEFDLPEGIRPVEADPAQIKQVINNLVINADHAMPGGGTLKVSARNVEAVPGNGGGAPLRDGEYVHIALEDRGIGIPKEHVQKVFDPYFTTKSKGSGLGLTTAYSIVKNHEGHMQVESILGRGTAFHIYLPASTERPASAALKRPRSEKKGGEKILVMDDEEMILELTEEILRHLGYKVEFAREGEEAVEAYKEAMNSGEPYDAVIMDLTIPGGMGGKDAVARLLEIDPGVKAIVSSGYSNDPVLARYRDYGFSAVVAKPYKVNELAEAVTTLLAADD